MSRWDEAMRRAVALATDPEAPRGVNPRVGCVIVDTDGIVVGEGFHRGAGTAHAEVVALGRAGSRARGSTAVVTLEPCRHTGRTPPCTMALLDAGVARVVFGLADPTAIAGGGGEDLRRQGIEVISGVLAEECAAVNREWLHVQRNHRPFVTAKTAMSLDARVADASGGPTAITGAAARAWVHRLRESVGAVLVGTRTVVIDDPRLTARGPNDEALARQPLRVVMGRSDIPEAAALRRAPGRWLQVRSRDPHAVLRELARHDVHHVLLEGGPTILRAFLDAGLVDEACWFIAPVLLGGGPFALPGLSTPVQPRFVRLQAIGEDVLVIASEFAPLPTAGGR